MCGGAYVGLCVQVVICRILCAGGAYVECGGYVVFCTQEVLMSTAKCRRCLYRMPCAGDAYIEYCLQKMLM
jgi:hypothetical protein